MFLQFGSTGDGKYMTIVSQTGINCLRISSLIAPVNGLASRRIAGIGDISQIAGNKLSHIQRIGVSSNVVAIISNQVGSESDAAGIVIKRITFQAERYQRAISVFITDRCVFTSTCWSGIYQKRLGAGGEKHGRIIVFTNPSTGSILIKYQQRIGSLQPL